MKTEELQKCKVFAVSRDMARSPLTGEIHPFFRIDAGEWVNVVPITTENELVLVRQYRHGSQEITLEIPGGIIDPGETPAQAAARELLEETGYRAEGVEASLKTCSRLRNDGQLPSSAIRTMSGNPLWSVSPPTRKACISPTGGELNIAIRTHPPWPSSPQTSPRPEPKPITSRLPSMSASTSCVT